MVTDRSTKLLEESTKVNVWISLAGKVFVNHGHFPDMFIYLGHVVLLGLSQGFVYQIFTVFPLKMCKEQGNAAFASLRQ